ncbi:RNA polymerase sigma factor [Parasphingorhabdus sp.]|uniref:RNA polymerase sigma factor n=1 Tax=Parasphingorhabdus sp. TaxID=2709688 RepID=UPI003C76A942
MLQNKSGLSQVFEDNRALLLRFLAARTRDIGLAEDLLQDVWIKITTGTQSGPIDNPLAYLYKMCEYTARDAHRSATRKLARDTLWSEAGSDFSAERRDNLTPEKIAIERDLLKLALSELEKLPDRTKEIFIDCRINEITQKEIARRQNISLSAVEKHLQRAYQVINKFRKNNDAGLD